MDFFFSSNGIFLDHCSSPSSSLNKTGPRHQRWRDGELFRERIEYGGKQFNVDSCNKTVSISLRQILCQVEEGEGSRSGKEVEALEESTGKEVEALKELQWRSTGKEVEEHGWTNIGAEHNKWLLVWLLGCLWKTLQIIWPLQVAPRITVYISNCRSSKSDSFDLQWLNIQWILSTPCSFTIHSFSWIISVTTHLRSGTTFSLCKD